jgi:EmrB/QacA subfamily drug resistance transporter
VFVSIANRSSEVLIRGGRWRWVAFAAAIAAAVMDLLDTTIAQVAAPVIRHDIGGTYAMIEWITAAYALATAVGLLTGGRLGDLYGRKRVLLGGMVVFVACSAACAAAVNPGELIAARVAQGFAGSIMLPQVYGLIRDLFAPEEMGRAFGVYGPVMGLSAMLGPVLSGGLIDADLLGTGWRMIFLINLPVGIVAAALGWRLLPDVRPERVPGARLGGLDLAGTLLAGTGMFLLVFPLAEGQQLGWPLWSFAMLIASVAVLAGLARHQLARKARGLTPLVEPSIFARGAYASGLVFSIAFIGSLGGIVLIFNVFLQTGLRFSPWHAALTTAPWAGGAFVGSAIGGIAMAKLGRRVLQAGLIIEALGLTAIYLVLQAAGAGVSSLDLIAPMIVGGAGMGMVFVPLFDIVMAGVEQHEMGSAAAVLQAVNGLAMSLGVAGIGAIFFGLIGSGGALGFVHAAQGTAVVCVGLLAGAFVIAFWLPRHAREAGALPQAGPELVLAGAAAGPDSPAGTRSPAA